MDKTHFHYTEALKLWKQYQNATTKDEKDDALYLMGELKRKVEKGIKIEELPDKDLSETLDIINETFGASSIEEIT